MRIHRCFLPAVLIVGLLLRTEAQLARESAEEYPNYDVRDDAEAATRDELAMRGATSDAEVVARMRQNMREAQTKLAARIPSFRLESNPRKTAPEAIGTESARQFLTGESSRPRAEVARDFLRREAALFGLTSDQIAALVPIADYANPAGNMSWVEYRQDANGLPIFGAEIRFGFTAKGALARATSNLAPALDYSRLTTQAELTPAQAAVHAAASIGYTLKETESARGPFTRAIEPILIYFPLRPGAATLAYQMTLWENVYAYTIIVDANDGTLLWRKNITAHQTQSATYFVYTSDSPAPLTPTNALPGQGTQAPAVARTSVTVIGNEPPNTFNNLGWITDGGNATTGNNVNCGLDLVSPNGVDPGSQATGSPNRVFNFAFNPAPGGTDAPTTAASRNGAITNLFYWTNVYHDRLYLLGFNEAARNFQTDNFGRGGLGNDAVSAEVQDSSGVNNANFSTPGDGGAGRMQMYLFTNPSPQRDGALDGEVFIHELTHGTSNRLHNNGSGLATQQSGGMGEGWSDYYARALLSSADEDVNGVYASGSYVTLQLGAGFTDNYYYGIRRFPYAVKSNLGPSGKPHNPMTFGDIDFVQINALNDGAFPPSPVINLTANEVHNIGTIWCMMLLEMRARMIARLGWATGNQRALQIVTDAMKLDVSSPTILQARDSLIAADNAGYGGEDVVNIRNGFAARGAGASATVSGSTFFTVVESFYPSSTAGAITFNDSLGNNNGVAEPGEDLVFNIPLTDRLTSADNNVSARLDNYSASYGNIAAAATIARSFNYHVPTSTACGTTLQIPFLVTSDNGAARVTIPLSVGAPANTVSFSQNFDGVTAPALPPGWTTLLTGSATATWVTTAATVIDSGNCAFGPDISSAADSSLVSPSIAIPVGNQQLSFKHRYTTQTSSDGGVLEISIAGGAFTDIVAAGGSFVQGGYGASITSGATGNVLIGRRVWSGSITTTNQVIVNLPSAASGQSVQLRWRFASNTSTSSTGWFIDSVQIYSTSYNCASIDSDGDGVPDGYETAHGLNPNDAGDAAADDDGDGFSNLEEYRAGTDPSDANSLLRLTSVARDPATGLSSLAFPTVNGKTYRIEYNPEITNPLGWSTMVNNIVGTGGTIMVADPTSHDQAYYRLVVIF